MSSAPQTQKSGSFGERLRRERELRGIKLDEICESTKISKRNLLALEEEHFDQLPGGIFNKGFVRAYARYLGLDEEQAVNDFLAASANYEQPAALQPPPATSLVKAPVMPSEAATARRQRFWALLAALILVVGLALWFQFGRARFEDYRQHRRAQPKPESAAPPAQVVPSASAETSQVANAAGSDPVAKPATNDQKSTKSSASSPEHSGPAASTGITLELHASAPVWVSANVDGASVSELMLQAGDSRQLHADNKLILKTGNAAALEVSFNGKSLPTLGKEGQVRTLTFSPAGLQ
jgi:cytoskeleton protein RodZ